MGRIETQPIVVVGIDVRARQAVGQSATKRGGTDSGSAGDVHSSPCAAFPVHPFVCVPAAAIGLASAVALLHLIELAQRLKAFADEGVDAAALGDRLTAKEAVLV